MADMTTKDAASSDQARAGSEATLRTLSTYMANSKKAESRPRLGRVMSTLCSIPESSTRDSGQGQLYTQLAEVMRWECETWEVVEKPTLVDRAKNIFYGLFRKVMRSQLTDEESGVHEGIYNELDPDDDYVILGKE